MKYITEKNHIPVTGHYDCLVLGAGIAGIASALAAKRGGCKTLLIEKTLFPGGLATCGFVNKYLPLCDGKGKKVCGGIAEELLHESIRYGYSTLPPVWKDGKLKGDSHLRYETVFSPYDFVIALDELLEREGIDILYDTLFTASAVDESRCTVIIVESKKGRHAYTTGTVIDCTGDADLFSRAGVLCETEKNLLTLWAYITSFEQMAGALEKKNVLAGVNLWELGATFKDTPDNPEDAGGNEKSEYELFGPESITAFVKDGRRMLRKKMDENGQEGLTVAALPSMPQARKLRRIIGDKELTMKDQNTHKDDSIGCAPDWRKRGEVYEIPFGSLYSRKLVNVLTAGRTISAAGDTWEVIRSIPACAVTGQAAGTAAATAKERKVNAVEIPLDVLQERLEANGVILHF